MSSCVSVTKSLAEVELFASNRFAWAEMAMSKNRGISLEPMRQMDFSDVDMGAWYAPAIYALADAGLMNGHPGNLFQPDTPIARAEAVVVLCRLLRCTESLPESLMELGRFSDVQEDWRYLPIQEASVSHFAAD